MQEIRKASYQQISNSLNKAMIFKYLLVVFALSLGHSFRVGRDYLLNSTQ